MFIDCVTLQAPLRSDENWPLCCCNSIKLNVELVFSSSLPVCSWRVAARSPGFQLTLAVQLRKSAVNPHLSHHTWLSKTAIVLKLVIIMTLHIFHLLLSELLFAIRGAGQSLVHRTLNSGKKSPADHRGDQQCLNESPGRYSVEISATKTHHIPSCCCCCRMNCYLRLVWVKSHVQPVSWVCCGPTNIRCWSVCPGRAVCTLSCLASLSPDMQGLTPTLAAVRMCKNILEVLLLKLNCTQVHVLYWKLIIMVQKQFILKLLWWRGTLLKLIPQNSIVFNHCEYNLSI